MIKQDINKDLNIILSFSDVVIPSIFKNNLRTIHGSRLKRIKNTEALRTVRYLIKNVCSTLKSTCSFMQYGECHTVNLLISPPEGLFIFLIFAWGLFEGA